MCSCWLSDPAQGLHTRSRGQTDCLGPILIGHRGWDTSSLWCRPVCPYAPIPGISEICWTQRHQRHQPGWRWPGRCQRWTHSCRWRRCILQLTNFIWSKYHRKWSINCIIIVGLFLNLMLALECRYTIELSPNFIIICSLCTKKWCMDERTPTAFSNHNI